jgi:hypothetical protein
MKIEDGAKPPRWFNVPDAGNLRQLKRVEMQRIETNTTGLEPFSIDTAVKISANLLTSHPRENVQALDQILEPPSPPRTETALHAIQILDAMQFSKASDFLAPDSLGGCVEAPGMPYDLAGE